eukprot:GHVR01119312.1.p1 GENE.GHVR01119312.1~~GHVR01119312.1.p1  ORF type:complete len:160 (+),score=40.78 GHVR01119312.1:269-748(+)
MYMYEYAVDTFKLIKSKLTKDRLTFEEKNILFAIMSCKNPFKEAAVARMGSLIILYFDYINIIKEEQNNILQDKIIYYFMVYMQSSRHNMYMIYWEYISIHKDLPIKFKILRYDNNNNDDNNNVMLTREEQLDFIRILYKSTTSFDNLNIMKFPCTIKS